MPPKLADFDTLAAEIDTIKADVQHMRAEAEHQQNLEETYAMRQQRNTHVRAEGSKIPAPAMSRLTTAKTSELSKTGTGIGVTTSPGKDSS